MPADRRTGGQGGRVGCGQRDISARRDLDRHDAVRHARRGPVVGGQRPASGRARLTNHGPALSRPVTVTRRADRFRVVAAGSSRARIRATSEHSEVWVISGVSGSRASSWSRSSAPVGPWRGWSSRCVRSIRRARSGCSLSRRCRNHAWLVQPDQSTLEDHAVEHRQAPGDPVLMKVLERAHRSPHAHGNAGSLPPRDEWAQGRPGRHQVHRAPRSPFGSAERSAASEAALGDGRSQRGVECRSERLHPHARP
jgi:hypothetical protein